MLKQPKLKVSAKPVKDARKNWKRTLGRRKTNEAMRQSVAGEQASTGKAQDQQTTGCRARRHERKDWLLTRGDPGPERDGKSAEVVVARKSGESQTSEGPKNERTKLNEKLEQ